MAAGGETMDTPQTVDQFPQGPRTGWEATFHECLPDQLLTWFRAGRLRKQDADILEAHLSVCPICQLQLSDLDLPVSRRTMRSHHES